MSYLDDFKRMTGQTELPSLEEAAMLQEQTALFEAQFDVLLDALHEVAEEEDLSDDVVRGAYEAVMSDEDAADELAELFRSSSGGSSGATLRGGSIGNDPTRAAYAKAFGPKAVAKAERKAMKGKAKKKMSPSELKKIRSAAAKKAWDTRGRGKGKKAAKPGMWAKIKAFAKKAIRKVKKAFSGKPKTARA